MVPLSLTLYVHGYWLEDGIHVIPDVSGIYFVYEATHISDKKILLVNRLIYIGEAEKIRERIIGHEKWKSWKKYVRGGSQLCFAYALADPTLRKRIEAAIIFKHKPPVNDEYRITFPFDSTIIKLEGKTSLLDQYFTVHEMISIY